MMLFDCLALKKLRELPMKYRMTLVALLLSGSAAVAQTIPVLDPALMDKILSERQIVQSDRAALNALRAQLEIDEANGDVIAIANDNAAIATAKATLQADFTTLRNDIKTAALTNRNIEKELRAQLKIAKLGDDVDAINELKASIEENKKAGLEIRLAMKFERESEKEASNTSYDKNGEQKMSESSSKESDSRGDKSESNESHSAENRSSENHSDHGEGKSSKSDH
jgi:hypothetical protein